MNSGRIEPRSAVAENFEFLGRLQREAMGSNVQREFEAWDEAFQRELFEASTKPKAHEIIEFDRKPFGCQWVRALPEALELERLQLLPGVEGSGIGTLAMPRLIAKANWLGFAITELGYNSKEFGVSTRAARRCRSPSVPCPLGRVRRLDAWTIRLNTLTFRVGAWRSALRGSFPPSGWSLMAPKSLEPRESFLYTTIKATPEN